MASNNYCYDFLEKFNANSVKNVKRLFVFSKGNKEEDKFLVTQEDNVYAFGTNNSSCLALGRHGEVIEPTIVKDFKGKGIIDFACGLNHFLALTKSGKLYCWGKSSYDFLGDGLQVEQAFDKPIRNTLLEEHDITQMACGFNHTLVLTKTGVVFSWGQNNNGQIGNGREDKHQLKPYEMHCFNTERITQISCGSQHSLVLTDNNSVFSWGDNNRGQLGLNNKKRTWNFPQRIKLKEDIKKISCGKNHNLMLTFEGNIFVFGDNRYGQLGIGNKRMSRLPIKLNFSKKFVDIATHSSLDVSVSQSENKRVYYWGKCDKNELVCPIESKHIDFDWHFADYHHLTYRTINLMDKIDSVKKSRYKRKYDELEVIACGHYGIVCKANIKRKDKFYAIKKIPMNKKDVKKVRMELKILKNIQSIYVVKLYNFWVEPNYLKHEGFQMYANTPISSTNPAFTSSYEFLLHIRMEYCYSTLKEVIEKIRSELNRGKNCLLNTPGYFIASQLFIEIIEAVNFLHKLKPPIIHRDLKPTNILITDQTDGRFIKLADFGLATFHKTDQSHSSATGTCEYMAPEVAGRKYNMKADIYSLGILLSELFNFNINDKRVPDYQLLDYYSKIKSLFMEMTSIKQKYRPECNEILRTKKTWSMDFEYLENYYDLSKIKSLPSDDNIFTKHFIRKKMIYKKNQSALLKSKQDQFPK